MIIKQKVEDLQTFKKAFDDLRENRRQAGLVDIGQFHAAGEANTVVVIMQVEDIERAREYWHSDVLARGRQKAGVVGPTEINPEHVLLTDGLI